MGEEGAKYEAGQTLDQWMSVSRDELLQMDEASIMQALMRITDRTFELGAILKQYVPLVSAAQQEIKVLSLAKSSLQSVLRTLRDVG
jgi:hypothetical protein